MKQVNDWKVAKRGILIKYEHSEGIGYDYILIYHTQIQDISFDFDNKRFCITWIGEESVVVYGLSDSCPKSIKDLMRECCKLEDL